MCNKKIKNIENFNWDDFISGNLRPIGNIIGIYKQGKEFGENQPSI